MPLYICLSFTPHLYLNISVFSKNFFSTLMATSSNIIFQFLLGAHYRIHPAREKDKFYGLRAHEILSRFAHVFSHIINIWNECLRVYRFKNDLFQDVSCLTYACKTTSYCCCCHAARSCTPTSVLSTLSNLHH